MKTADRKFIHLPVLGLLAVVLALSACNTIEGAGKDVKATGNAIEDTAHDAKEKM